MAPLANTKVVIIGGSSGLGFAVAKAALAEGASVVIASSSSAKVAAAVARLGDRVIGEALDVNDEAAVKSFFEKTGKFNHLVFTADGPLSDGFPNVELAKAKNTLLDARYWGLLSCVQQSKPFLSDSITLTSGLLAHHPTPGWSVGAGLAGATVATARNLALDLAPVRVNCIVPGVVDTEMWEGMPADLREQLFGQTKAKLPVQHVGTAAEVADAYLFAMKCSYFTGQSVIVDGGSSIV